MLKNLNNIIPNQNIQINNNFKNKKIKRNKSIKQSKNKEINQKIIEDKNDKINYNELPFNQAIKLDKRNFFKIFSSIIVEKIEIIDLFNNNQTFIKEILFCQYILSLIIDFFFNALFYSDDIVSQKYHNNGKLLFIASLALSILSNIITSLVCYILSYHKGIEKKLIF